MKYYKLTNYPRLFKNTYWGQFDADNGLLSQSIIKNRNDFVDDYEINEKVKHTKTVRKFLHHFTPKGFIDHLEIYKNTHNDYVILTSPYQWKEECPKYFCQIDRLYNVEALTYVCILNLEQIRYLLQKM
jgi:hypothetical protein